jgi:pilus assembly protein CpaF
VRGGEAIDMLQAMNTGHEGSMSTAHANTSRDVLSRLETMALMSDLDLPVSHVREQIASALDMIIHTTRTADGRRRVAAVTSIVGMRGGVIRTEEVFEGARYQQAGSRPSSSRARAFGPASGRSPAARHDGRGRIPTSRGRAWAGTPRHLGTVLE